VKTWRYWMFGMGSGDPAATAKALREMGFDVVVGGATDAVRAAGMEAWTCGGAFGLAGDDPDERKAMDVLGARRVWFGSGCPNNPEIRSRNLRSYEQMAATPGVTGILVDGCRFASPASGLDAYLTCFCDTCREKAGRLGFDFGRMQGDVRALREALTSHEGTHSSRPRLWARSAVGILDWLTDHPGVLDWLRFRRTCTTEHFRAISQIIHGAGKRMGVYIFTPSIAPLVGQSYVDLREFVDVFAPMIYRNYPKGPGEACLNWELTNIPEQLMVGVPRGEDHAMDLALSWTGLAGVVPDRSIARVRAGLPPDAVGNQTSLARRLIGPDPELAPIIYIEDPVMRRTVNIVRANGADGVSFFVFMDAWAKLVRPAMRS